MAEVGSSSKAVTVPGLVEVRATQVSPPPGWALLERQLMKLMEEAVPPMVDKYAEKGGAFYFADDVDDLYERVYNWGLFYAMGADRQVLDLALQQWHATTRFFADDIVSRVHPASVLRSTTNTTTRLLPVRMSGTTRGRATWLSTISVWPVPRFRKTCAAPGDLPPCSWTKIPKPPTTTPNTKSSAAPCRPASAPCATPASITRSCGFRAG